MPDDGTATTPDDPRPDPAAAHGITVTVHGGNGGQGQGTSTRATTVATGGAMGPRGSLHRIGIAGGVSIGNPGSGSVDEVLAKAATPQKYVIAGEIDRGGMGTILRAVDRDLRREVAMKVLNGGDDARTRRRFIEEAQVAGQLEHPNIVPVHELEVDADGRVFFTMKLVRGRSLAQVLEDLRIRPDAVREWPLSRLLRIFLSVLNAMAFAHDRGVIHRDLKPANLMLGDYGEVLVMDWGLAQVRRPASQPGEATALRQADLAGYTKSDRLGALVESIRSGTVEGTPAYMSPEQARGDLAAIDERSDVYALGAILYEILTLHPPVSGRTLRETLDAAIAGIIPVPESRAGAREVPPELSAIARKALAREKEHRYQQVLELRRDVELWFEDRAVSAKEDSTIEALVKLIRRNKEVAIATAVCLLIVIGVTVASFVAIVRERHRFRFEKERAEENLAKLEDAQRSRTVDQQRTAPALVAKARQSLDRREFAEALADARLAAQFDPELSDAHLLLVWLAINRRAWDDALSELDTYLIQRPDDTDSRRLQTLLTAEQQESANPTPGTGDTARLTAIADLLVRQRCYPVAESLYGSAKRLAAVYALRLERAWPGSTTREGSFEIDADGMITFRGLHNHAEVTDLSPLEGLPIAKLALAGTRVVDLSPLLRMPLTHLDLNSTFVRDLSPLSDLPLVSLRLARTRVDDLRPLAGRKLESLDVSGTGVADLSPLAGMPLKDLRVAGCIELTDLTPITGQPLTVLDFSNTRIRDLSPLVGMPLTELDAGQTPVVDAASLTGRPLTRLSLRETRISDLSFLRGAPLTALDLSGTPVSDLRPLQGLLLTELNLAGTPVANLDPLRGMKLAELSLASTSCTDLAPLAGMPLAALDLSRTPVADLRPLRGAPLAVLLLDGTRVIDLAPLRTAPLKDLRLTGTTINDLMPLIDERGPGRSLRRLILPQGEPDGQDLVLRLPTIERVGHVWPGDWSKVPLVRR